MCNDAVAQPSCPRPPSCLAQGPKQVTWSPFTAATNPKKTLEGKVHAQFLEAKKNDNIKAHTFPFALVQGHCVFLAFCEKRCHQEVLASSFFSVKKETEIRISLQASCPSPSHLPPPQHPPVKGDFWGARFGSMDPTLLAAIP